MKIKNWMIGGAVICVFFGLGFSMMPATMLALYGSAADPVGMVMARFFGSAFVTLGLLMWFARNTTEPATQRAFALAAFVGNSIGFIVALIFQMSGIPNALGWSTVTLYLIFALGFGYFLIPGSDKAPALE